MHTTSRAQPLPDTTPVTAGAVVVLSRLQMVSQTVATALRARGVDADDIAWTPGVQRATHDLTGMDVVVLLDDLVNRDLLFATQDLVVRSPARFLILTDCPEGPGWGAMLVSGAVSLMSTRSSLGEVEAELSLVRVGVSSMGQVQRSLLVSEWVGWLAEDGDLRDRMERLSGRERTVIGLLARGYKVSEIGAELGIAEATVRSQVKSMRRKLDADSQLAAVAMVHRLGGVGRDPKSTLPRPRHPDR